MTERSQKYKLWQGLVVTPVLASFLGCGAKVEMSDSDKVRAQFCPPTSASHEFAETPFVGDPAKILSFQNIRASINSSCASCHQAPARKGGFTYIDSWQGKEMTIDGETKIFPGFFETAAKMQEYLHHPDEKKRMPPPERREKNPQAFIEMGNQLQAWMVAGKPNGTFEIGGGTKPPPRGKPRPPRPQPTTDLGDCTPTAKAIGFDFETDRRFETMTTLPKYLTETDLFNLDSFALAKKGTVAYNVEYPLWADNAEKGRWIHVPMKMENGEVAKQAIDYDFAKKQFVIPDNTRFYKSFYRAVLLPNKKTLMRRMETRIIVTRTPWEKSLFGTYQWNETEQIAVLVDAPYRDGSAWKDVVVDVMVDEGKEKIRPYAIPGRQRCIDCHMGSPARNFILGFTPLQLNRRQLGGAGRDVATSADELSQVNRLISYGVIKGVQKAEELPVLENSGTVRPTNFYEQRANGYTTGNCYHCHNPNGLAFSKENGIRLPLGPGDLFQFNTQQKSVQIPNRRIVHQNGELDGSHIWRKVSDGPTQHGMFSQMPMHTPGSPDCRVLNVIGKWVRSFESSQAAELFTPECKKENPFYWIDSDFTWVDSENYTPRRNDWQDPAVGMPPRYRNLTATDELLQAIKSEYAVGYWLKKPLCKFPETDLPADERRPWMMTGDKPKRPFGEVYYTTPGSYFFRTTCMKCHGPRADGDSSLARGILNWSGGSVRVANLIDGMFGKKTENLKTFDVPTENKNLAGQYLIWMAMEGTRVKFPPELSSYMGKHGGQMLNGLREKCLAQIASSKNSSPLFMDHEVFAQVCFIGNLQPGHPDLQFDPRTDKPLHPERVEEWLDRGAFNAGWAIFEFLKEAGGGSWRPRVDECEIQYPGGQ